MCGRMRIPLKGPERRICESVCVKAHVRGVSLSAGDEAAMGHRPRKAAGKG